MRMAVNREYKFLLKRVPKQSEDFHLCEEKEIKQAFVNDQELISQLISSNLKSIKKSEMHFGSLRLREAIKGGKSSYTVSLVSDDPLIQRFKHEIVVNESDWTRKYQDLFNSSPYIQKVRKRYKYKSRDIWRVDEFTKINKQEVSNLVLAEISNENAVKGKNAPIEMPDIIRNILISDVTHECGYKNEYMARIGRPLPTVNIAIVGDDKKGDFIKTIREIESDSFSEAREYLTKFNIFKNIDDLLKSQQDFNYIYLQEDVEPYETPLDVRFDLIVYRMSKRTINRSDLQKIQDAKLLFRNLKIVLWKDSEDMESQDYQIYFDGNFTGDKRVFKDEIEKLLKQFGRIPNHTGVLITHGTDTLSYGLEYLKYAIKKPNFNTILTGSQIPMGNPYESSDGNTNISSSLLLLNRLKATVIGVSFDFGRKFFSTNIVKINKWDSDAFYGYPDCKIEFEEIADQSREFQMIKKNYRLNKLFVFRTGGTIESMETSSGYSPKGGADFVISMISDHLNQYYYEVEDHSVFQEDSSNLTFTHWAFLANQIREKVGSCDVDSSFDEIGIKVLYLAPWMTQKDYLPYFRRDAKAVVLLGYGGGNGNCISKESYKEKDFSKRKEFRDIERYNLKRHVEKYLKQSARQSEKKHIRTVVLSSQVTLGVIDPVYEVGKEFIKVGAIPGANLGVPEILVRLSYLYGHEDEFFHSAEKIMTKPGPLKPIIEKSQHVGRDARFDLAEYLFKTAFLCKTRFRTEKSLDEFAKLTAKYYGRPLFILDDNPFIFNYFHEGLRELLDRVMKVV